MPRYDTYFLMKEADVIDYVQTKYPGHFDKDAVLTVKEIGDGNLNYVFRVVEEKTGKSIIVKQAGEALRIDDRLNGLSGLVERRLHLSGFAQSFVNGALIYCVGAMAIIGALNDGLRGDASVLYIKSLLDGISSVVLGAPLGPGVIFAALPVLVYQGAMSLLAGALEPFLAGELLGQICGVGYCLVLCIGINVLGMTKIKTANMLPALLVPVLWSFLQPLFSGAA